MPTTTAVSTQKFSNSPSGTIGQPIRRAVQVLKTRAGSRYAKVAAMAFAATLPALGIIDPQVLMDSGMADVRHVAFFVSRADAALRNMAIVELFATGGVAALALAAMAGLGYLRTRYTAARQAKLAAE